MGTARRSQEAFDKQKYLDVASFLEHHHAVGLARVASSIKALYQRPSAPRPPTYDKLVELPLEHFITTNYDPWLKDALAAQLKEAPRVYGPTDAGAFADTGPGSSPLVLMCHGDADRPETCVLSSEGYRQLAHGSAEWRDGMKQLVGQHRLLFVGYSLADPDVVDLLDEWQAVFAPAGGATRHFLLDTPIKPMRKGQLGRRGIEAIDYGEHAVLPELLEHLGTPPSGARTGRGPSQRPSLRAYLRTLLDQTDHIAISGIGGGGGRVQTASRYPIEELYTPLRTRTARELGGPGGARTARELGGPGGAPPSSSQATGSSAFVRSSPAGRACSSKASLEPARPRSSSS